LYCGFSSSAATAPISTPSPISRDLVDLHAYEAVQHDKEPYDNGTLCRISSSNRYLVKFDTNEFSLCITQNMFPSLADPTSKAADVATHLLGENDSREKSDSDLEDAPILGRNVDYSTREGCHIFVASAFSLSQLN
jgi:hypothetical protein